MKTLEKRKHLGRGSGICRTQNRNLCRDIFHLAWQKGELVFDYPEPDSGLLPVWKRLHNYRRWVRKHRTTKIQEWWQVSACEISRTDTCITIWRCTELDDIQRLALTVPELRAEAQVAVKRAQVAASRQWGQIVQGTGGCPVCGR